MMAFLRKLGTTVAKTLCRVGVHVNYSEFYEDPDVVCRCDHCSYEWREDRFSGF